MLIKQTEQDYVTQTSNIHNNIISCLLPCVSVELHHFQGVHTPLL